MTVAEHTADRQIWMDKVDGVRETLIAHADAAEEQRTLPRPAVNALRDAGFFNLKLPLELGGAQADQALVMEVIEGLSYIHPAAGWCVVHRFLGLYDVKLRAARALALALFDEIEQTLKADKQVDANLLTRSRTLGTYVTELCVEITTQAFRYGGGGALFQPNILEQLLRDSQAAAQHIFASDTAYEEYGKAILGMA